MKKNLSKKEFLAISVMLFGMFFGAGNLIFPPLLGNKAGSLMPVALIAFCITAVVFPVLGIAVISKTNGLTNLSQRCGKYFALIFTCMIHLSIGPGLGIPRAGSLPFEMAVAPYLKENLFAARILYTFMFFLVAYLVCLKPSKLVSRMGKFLTPALLVLITAMFLGVVFKTNLHIASPSSEYANNSVVKGFLEGYNTMDTVAALNFGLVVTLAVRSFKIEEKYVTGYTIKAGALAGFVLFLVYAMLSYIGMSTSAVYTNAKNGADILTSVTSSVFGSFGIVLLATIFTLACLTTCIGLITCVSKYFENLTNNKVSYNKWILLWTVLSFFVANFGLTTILKISVPILILIYPVSIVLILLGLSHKLLNLDNLTYKCVCYPTVVISLVEALNALHLQVPFLTDVVSRLPLFKISLGWVIPMIVCLVLSLLRQKLCLKRALN